MQLRNYQEEAITAVLESSVPSVCVCPTGAGKSLIIAGLIKKLLELAPHFNVIVLQHRKELIEQNHDKFCKIAPELFLKAGIYSASLKLKEIKQITFAAIQSIYNKDVPHVVNMLLIDECHLINPKDVGMYRELIAKLQAKNPCCGIFGFTATPFRLKSGMIFEGEESLFKDMCYDIGIKELIHNGYLSRLVTKFGQQQADMSNARIRGGEYMLEDIEDAINPLTQAACDEICTLGKDRKHWLVFCPSVKNSYDVAAAFEAKGVRAVTVTGEMSMEERDAAFKDFSSGRARVLTNCEVATTGYDFPSIDLIALLRPTKSAGLYMQMVGRGLRTAPGKENCLVLDFGGNIERFGAIDCIKVRKLKGKHVLNIMPLKKCPQCGNGVQISVMTCPECGHVFERLAQDHEAEASALPILSEEVWFNVVETSYKVHRKEGKPPSLKVTHHLEGGDFCSEFICFNHGGYATRKAYQWWKQNVKDPNGRLPESAVDGFTAMGTLKKVKRVLLQKDGRFWRVNNREFFEEGEYYHSSTEELYEELGVNL